MKPRFYPMATAPRNRPILALCSGRKTVVKWEGPPLRDWCYWSEYDDTPVPVLGYPTGWRELE
jgi:hypothetical protein